MQLVTRIDIFRALDCIHDPERSDWDKEVSQEELDDMISVLDASDLKVVQELEAEVIAKYKDR